MPLDLGPLETPQEPGQSDKKGTLGPYGEPGLGSQPPAKDERRTASD